MHKKFVVCLFIYRSSLVRTYLAIAFALLFIKLSDGKSSHVSMWIAPSILLLSITKNKVEPKLSLKSRYCQSLCFCSSESCKTECRYLIVLPSFPKIKKKLNLFFCNWFCSRMVCGVWNRTTKRSTWSFSREIKVRIDLPSILPPERAFFALRVLMIFLR